MGAGEFNLTYLNKSGSSHSSKELAEDVGWNQSPVEIASDRETEGDSRRDMGDGNVVEHLKEGKD